MKVLSLTEPYATLIKENKKIIETRSWKTSYRGELYIHAGKSTVKEKMKLVSDYNLEYPNGYIIAKVNLVDCILVTKSFDDELKNSNTIVYSHEHVGLYAWKLENIKKYKEPIYVKGKLSLWEYKN